MSYIGTQPIPKATLLRTTGVLASASTTINVPATFMPGNTWVFINGAYVLPTDYNDSNGTDLIFTTALDAGTEYIVMEALQFEGSITPSLAGGASANFTAMPQVGGDPIVESGSNADGEWTRWSDGTQTATATVAFDFSVAGPVNSVTQYPYPTTFVKEPGCGCSLTATSSTALLSDESTMVLSARSAIWELRLGQSTSGFGLLGGNTLNAIGRWK